MRTYLECIPCFFQQTLRTARIITNDEVKIKEIFDRVGAAISHISLTATPAETGALVYRIISEVTGVEDPYKEIKEEYTRRAEELVPFLNEMIEKSEDRLYSAVKVAIAGNIIDFGVNRKFSLEQELQEIYRIDLTIDDYEILKKDLQHDGYVLYIGDNAGEAVFDRLLIEELKRLGKEVYFAVRSRPVINDVTYGDAVAAGIDEVAEIIDSGVDAPGTVLHLCSKEFLELFDNAAVVISKGQGNYEALSDASRRVFFMLKAKCAVVARHLGVKEEALILKHLNSLD